MDYAHEAAQVFDKHAAWYEKKFMDQSKYQPGFDLFAQHLPANAAVLELACGPGNTCQATRNKRPDLAWLGIDLAPNMVDLAKKNNPDAQFQCMDIRDVRKLDQKFQGVMGAFCLPYLDKMAVEQLISDLCPLLLPNAYLYWSTMEDNYACSGYEYTSDKSDRICMHYYLEQDLKIMLEKCGIEIIHSSRLPYQKRDGTDGDELILIARKNAGLTIS
ncbi:MAG: methyltransferase domain-containing protein [Bacteroidetes bacterium]|nr:methyltransferase domain-containing protein [Bacteroidota bacterium]